MPDGSLWISWEMASQTSFDFDGAIRRIVRIKTISDQQIKGKGVQIPI
jgi:hypothetical protein